MQPRARMSRGRMLGLFLALLVLLILPLTVSYSLLPPFLLPTPPAHPRAGEPVYYRGEVAVLTVRMTTSQGVPVPDELTLFLDEGNDLLIGGAYTNASGYAVLEWSIPSDYHMGLITIKAYCPNNSDAVPVYLNLIVKSSAPLENLPHPSALSPGEALTVWAVLLDNLGAPVSNASLELRDAQNNTLSSATTDSQGNCSLSWLVPFNASLGVYTFRVVFTGTESYGPVEEAFSVTVSNSPGDARIVSVFLNVTRVRPGENVLVVVNTTVVGSSVSVLVNGVELTLVDGATWMGVIKAPSTPGEYTLSVVLICDGEEQDNYSSTLIVEAETQSFPAGVLLAPLLSQQTPDNMLVPLVLGVSIAFGSAFVAWRKAPRQPRFSRDYTLDVRGP